MQRRAPPTPRNVDRAEYLGDRLTKFFLVLVVTMANDLVRHVGSAARPMTRATLAPVRWRWEESGRADAWLTLSLFAGRTIWWPVKYEVGGGWPPYFLKLRRSWAANAA